MLGLDIGTRSLYLVRTTHEGILAYGQYPLPHDCLGEGERVIPERVAEAISRLARAMRVRERSVILTIGGAQVMTKWVMVPRMSVQELNESAPYEAPRHLPPAKEPMVYRFWVPDELLVVIDRERIPRPNQEQKHSEESQQGDSDKMPARLVAVPESELYARLDSAILAGLNPVGIVPEPDALTHLLTRENRPQSVLWRGRAIAIVGIRYDYTEMTIARETHLEFARTLPWGVAEAIGILQRSLGASFEEAEVLLASATLDEEGTLHFPDTLGLAPLSLLGFLHNLTTEMRRLAEFQRSRYPEGSYLGLIDSFMLTGEGTLLQGLASYCSRSLGITCLISNLTQGFAWKVPVQDVPPAHLNRYAVALGAGMSGVMSIDDLALQMEAIPA